ncbi:nitrogenase molybdenum-iron protein alpha chain [Pseudobutyrivibrio sp. ACV-2]|uniref:nitrogenase component 1 n=1 Tax=Pseudobutyrivibrio sp. ACV-2 TaxID=1520801 RepID=UPI0008960F99|nr:nitrogenase component 1 [Pseudobutyrivibrio sp. ACV-2]SEA20182.1 nitrogenase molybdenum-iron protein alpha chain [Pseudobutyrivibrio sp. ACV-2]
MSFLDERKALTREKRLSALSHFHGTLEGLIDETSGAEIKQRVRTFSQIHIDETINAFEVLSKIEDAAIIVNGSVGCGNIGLINAGENYNWYSTNLVERDTILGGDDKLREAVLRANEEQHPKAIFIIGTPVVAINNDDINSVILELEDEVGVPIISIYTDGFKTKTPVTGYDIVTHSLLKYVVDKFIEEKEDFINIISFSESIEDIEAVTESFEALNINYQVIPRFSSIEDIKAASRARATVVLNPEEGEYLAKELEEVFNVPYIASEAPIGFRGTKKFLLKLATFLNIEDKAIKYVDEIEEELTKSLTKDLLADKKVFVDASFSRIPAYARFLQYLGGTIVGIGSPFIDLENRKQIGKLDFLSKGTTVVIGNGQYFEKANAISKSETDLYITEYTGGSFAIDEGAAVVSTNKIETYGFKGVLVLHDAIVKALRFVEKADVEESIYKASWKRRSGNWYVKQEVS